MFKVDVYHGTELYMTHSQTEYDTVMQIAINSVLAVRQQRGSDFRVEMRNKAGDIFFLALGPDIQAKNVIN